MSWLQVVLLLLQERVRQSAVEPDPAVAKKPEALKVSHICCRADDASLLYAQYCRGCLLVVWAARMCMEQEVAGLDNGCASCKCKHLWFSLTGGQDAQVAPTHLQVRWHDIHSCIIWRIRQTYICLCASLSIESLKRLHCAHPGSLGLSAAV